MITLIECPDCHSEFLFEIKAKVQATRLIKDSNVEVRHRLKDLKILGAYNKDNKLQEIVLHINSILKDGVSIDDLDGILREEYKLSRCCVGMVIDKIKEDYSMYSPDGRHLYFI